MTITDVIDRLSQERQTAPKARFHCRAIMVDDVPQYLELLNRLNGLGNISVFPIDELFSGADVMPDYMKLTDKPYQDQWVILPGVSEYLRLFHSNEETAQRFGSLWHHQWDATTTGRVLIPLWGCEALWHDTALGLCDDIRQQDFLFDCTTDPGMGQHLNLSVLSGGFEQYVGLLSTLYQQTFIGLREWYESWYSPKADVSNQLLLTRRCRSIKTTDGDVKIHVIRDMLGFLQENILDGDVLTETNCPPLAQDCLFHAALTGMSNTDNAILSALNVHKFTPIDVMSKWITMTDGQKQLVFLWYQLHHDDSYLCHCVNNALDSSELETQVLTAVFAVRTSHPEWVAESQQLISAMSLTRTEAYYAMLEEISSFDERLDYLSANDAKSRVYILHLVGSWLRIDKDEVLHSEKLAAIYPPLVAYLKDSYPDAALNAYFGKYKAYKLSNTLPPDEDNCFAGISTEDYDYRYPVLSEEKDANTFVLWIDALGIEWLPLLKWAIEKNCNGDIVSVRVAQAQLPSETVFNEQWHQMDLPYKKYDKLDKLAHKGVIDDKDYYACVEQQLLFVNDIVEIINNKLAEYGRIIITGDHGTSRLAARLFHKREGLPAPENAVIGSHGRFCRVDEEPSAFAPSLRRAKDGAGNRYFVFANYDHYKKSGFAAGADDDTPIYGEIHGGAAPEEMLVPVITVVSRCELPLTAEWQMPGKTVKIRAKQAKCRIRFSRPVTTIVAKIGTNEAVCKAETVPSVDWELVFSGVKAAKSCTVSILADGTLVNPEPIELLSPLGGGNDPF